MSDVMRCKVCNTVEGWKITASRDTLKVDLNCGHTVTISEWLDQRRLMQGTPKELR